MLFTVSLNGTRGQMYWPGLLLAYCGVGTGRGVAVRGVLFFTIWLAYLKLPIRRHDRDLWLASPLGAVNRASNIIIASDHGYVERKKWLQEKGFWNELSINHYSVCSRMADPMSNQTLKSGSCVIFQIFFDWIQHRNKFDTMAKRVWRHGPRHLAADTYLGISTETT